MQQYFIQITEKLKERGYQKLLPNNNSVYVRVVNNTIYVIVVGGVGNLDKNTLSALNSQICSQITEKSEKRIDLLNILLIPTGMLDETIQDIVASMNNVWLFSEDYGKLYVYENQPQDFDGLYEVLDRRIDHTGKWNQRGIREMYGVVTPILILINVVIYIVSVLCPKTNGYSNLMFFLAADSYDIAGRHEYYRLITAMFYHFNLLHLLSNMLALLALGSCTEKILGKTGYLLGYFLTGLTASFTSFISNIDKGYIFSGGASGAIFGLLGILVIYAFCNHGRVSGISIQELIRMIFWTFLIGILAPGIDNHAHIGGLVAGLIVGIITILYRQSKQKVVKDNSM